jgi:hypothetical protein
VISSYESFFYSTVDINLLQDPTQCNKIVCKYNEKESEPLSIFRNVATTLHSYIQTYCVEKVLFFKNRKIRFFDIFCASEIFTSKIRIFLKSIRLFINFQISISLLVEHLQVHVQIKSKPKKVSNQ